MTERCEPTDANHDADAAPGAGGDNSGTGAKAGHGDERPTGDEQELATKMLQIQSKRFYLDVKQNWRGRFIKIAEVSAGGRKSRLLMSMQAAGEFKHHLDEFVQFYEKLDAPDPAAALPEDGQLMSRVMVKENRRYYIDLKENNRGRFLRVTQTARTAPALAAVYGGGPGVRREQIAIPAEGLAQLAVALAELTADFACDDSGIDASASLPDSRQLRADNKFFFFDFGQNSRGVFLRISEVRNNFRSAITIPERSWSQFGDIFAEVCASGAAGSSRSASAAAVTPDALDSDTQGVPKSPSSG